MQEVWLSESSVVTRVEQSGRHTGDLTSLPATGRSFRTSGLDVFVLPGEQVVQHWHRTDHCELFEQLGATVVPG